MRKGSRARNHGGMLPLHVLSGGRRATGEMHWNPEEVAQRQSMVRNLCARVVQLSDGQLVELLCEYPAGGAVRDFLVDELHRRQGTR